jgi:hypothetical protein
MKNLGLVLALGLGLVATSLTSCKKEDPKTPEPIVVNNGVDTTGNGGNGVDTTGNGGNGVDTTGNGGNGVDTTGNGGNGVDTTGNGNGNGCTMQTVDIVAPLTIATTTHFEVDVLAGGNFYSTSNGTLTDDDVMNGNNIVFGGGADLFTLDFKETSVSNLSTYENLEISFTTAKSNNVVITNLKVTIEFANGTTQDFPMDYVSGAQTFLTGVSNVADFQVSWSQTGSGELNVSKFSIKGDICQ